MYIVEFFKKDEVLDFCKVYVFDHTELLQLLNYIEKFEYILESVHRESICIGYENFKEFIKEYEEKEKPKGKTK